MTLKDSPIVFSLSILIFTVLFVIIYIGNGCISTIILSDNPGDIYDIIINNNDIHNIIKMILIINYIIVGILYLALIIGGMYLYQDKDTNKTMILILGMILLAFLIFYSFGLSYLHNFFYNKNKDDLNSKDKLNVMKGTIIMMHIAIAVSTFLSSKRTPNFSS
jgi:hypothetical protein